MIERRLAMLEKELCHKSQLASPLALPAVCSSSRQVACADASPSKRVPLHDAGELASIQNPRQVTGNMPVFASLATSAAFIREFAMLAMAASLARPREISILIRTMLARIPTMATTMRTSTRVNPEARFLFFCIDFFVVGFPMKLRSIFSERYGKFTGKSIILKQSVRDDDFFLLKKKDFGTMKASFVRNIMNKKRIFSGIQPSGNLHIGNYLGAIRQWVDLQNSYDSLFCIVDLHAITVPQDPAELRKKTVEITKIYLAAGIDPTKSTLFVQSQVSAHSELMWILNTITRNGDLTKMTQFKGKAGFIDVDDLQKAIQSALSEESQRKIFEKYHAPKPDGPKDIEDSFIAVSQETAKIVFGVIESKFKGPFNGATVGLFDYPVLMAADILIYDTDVVPVGKDQLQHVELARTLARRFNERFGETFVIPEGKLSKEGALIMGLDDPSKKMSKSAESAYNYIALSDTPDQVRRKIMKAVTDSGSEIAYADSKPALKNLINIYSLLSGETPEAIVAEFAGKGYGDFKKSLAEVVVGFLEPFQERLAELDDKAVLKILADGAAKAEALAEKKLLEAKEKVGFFM